MKDTEKIILLFDDTCNFCNGTVNFILARDKKDSFRFAPLQSEAGQKLQQQYGLRDGENDSMVVISGNRIFLFSDAALEISRRLPGLWPLLYVFKIVPPFLRNGTYKWIARNRYKWFGKSDSCRIPNEKERKKFLP